MKRKDTKQGRYLYSVRIRNGVENISEYLRNFKLPISDPYYRDVEGGRKTLSLEKALELAQALPIPEDEQQDIIHCVIQDALPGDVCGKLLRPRVNEEPESLKDLLDALQHDVLVHEEAYELARFKLEQTFLGTEEDIAYLDRVFEFLPILHYVYLVEKVSIESIKSLIKHCKIEVSADALHEFLGRICESDDNRIYRRKKRIFRVPKSEAGKRFKKRFQIDEIEKSISRDAKPPFSLDGTFETSGIYAIPKTELPKLRRKVRNLLAELDIKSSDLDQPDSEAFFVSLVTSSREEYAPASDLYNS